MTAAFDERLDNHRATKDRSRLYAMTRGVAETLEGKRKSKWEQIEKEITSGTMVSIRLCGCQYESPKELASVWVRDCKTAGISIGWFVMRWLFPLLLELAKRWIEANRTQESES